MSLKPNFKFFTVLIAVSLLLSCNKTATVVPLEDQPFEQRLEGIWTLVAVSFETEFPDPQNPLMTIEIEGEGEDVNGTMVVGHDPNELDYSYDFLANIQLNDTVPPIPVPVERDGSGTWSATSDESRIFVNEDGQSEYTFEVEVNELNRQVYHTSVEEKVFGVFTIEVNLELTFVR